MFLFWLQFSATLINLAQHGQIFYENQAHEVNLPKMGKYFTTIVGNQTDRGTAIDFHVLHTASPVATGGIWWANPRQTLHQVPQTEIWKL